LGLIVEDQINVNPLRIPNFSTTVGTSSRENMNEGLGSSNQLRSIDVYNTTNTSLLKAKTIYNHPLTKTYKVHSPFSTCLTNFKENIPHNLENNHTVKCCHRVYCQHNPQAPYHFQMLSMEEISKSMGSQLQQWLSQTQMNDPFCVFYTAIQQ